MKTAVLLVLAGAGTFLSGPQGSIDQEKLEAVRKLSPEERAKLMARLEELKKLPAEERERLRDNLAKIKSMPAEDVKKLREKAVRLSDSERRELGELAMGFFRWANRNGSIQGFPRAAFFQWLRNDRPEKLKEIREMSRDIREYGEVGNPRVDQFIKLSYEFRDVLQARAEAHVQKHHCVPYEEMHALRDAAFREFWPRWQEINRSCQGRKANPGPVPPRMIDAPRK